MAQTTFSGPVKSTNGFNGGTLTIEEGTGISTGTDTVYTSQITKVGNLITTHIYIDMDGLESSTTLTDIIGVNDAANCHLGRITVANSGIVFGGSMACLETPAGGDADIDLYSAVEATGTENAVITGLDEVALVTAAAVWVVSTAPRAFTASPRANDYLYLVVGVAGTAAEYTAGKFLIELYGYEA